MAVVLSSDENSYFSTSSLRRSHSQPKFNTNQTSSFPSHSAADSRKTDSSYSHPKIYPDSAPSSAPSSPQFASTESTDLSYASTPASNLSLASDCDDACPMSAHPDDHFVLPHYSAANFYDPEDLEPPMSPRTGDSYTVSPAENENDNSGNTSRPGSPEFVLEVDRAEDDTAVRAQPTRHVDYLSHNWREEDIWSSWKLKDCDVTWLYGPLQTGHNNFAPITSSQNSGILTKNNSFIHKKPILKKRSMSEVMLQRSLSASSLVKTAAAAVQAQESSSGGRRLSRPTLERASTTDYRKHIHFNEQVEQCIAVEIKGEEDEDEAMYSDRYDHSDSDEDAIMMKRSKTKKRVPIARRQFKKKKTTTQSEGKTIAMLPSTTLKYREDTPEPVETAMKHSTGVYRGPISQSSSRETLRPAKSSGRFFIEDDDDDDAAMEELLSPRGGWQSPATDEGALQRTPSTSSLNAEPAGMRRTPSGMFMPYEEGESGSNEGIIGRVVDTVNTARDIAHVIWNVGWRK
ncbi:hypothetical protein BN1723_006942 [Verticillium longisporum]|uniref:Nitrogen regulatory protein areA GATA-like domain-containing protein n=1 Tax=Verticillium longisporum TaxID=100787 RepID=A0A0G4NIJ5_VERLO|nr:hypothetical protein BN1723_006942 [Verticillium longisporum]